MKVLKLQLHNYKSFLDSDIIDFDPHMNVVVGKNNTGKSAFLEGLSLTFPANPHRSKNAQPDPTTRTPPGSVANVTVSIESAEVRKILLGSPNPFSVMFPAVGSDFAKQIGMGELDSTTARSLGNALFHSE